MKLPDVDALLDFSVAGSHGHVVNGQVIKPIRVGFDVPTFQNIVEEDGTIITIVNPALPEADRIYYQGQLDYAQSR